MEQYDISYLLKRHCFPPFLDLGSVRWEYLHPGERKLYGLAGNPQMLIVKQEGYYQFSDKAMLFLGTTAADLYRAAQNLPPNERVCLEAVIKQKMGSNITDAMIRSVPTYSENRVQPVME